MSSARLATRIIRMAGMDTLETPLRIYLTFLQVVHLMEERVATVMALAMEG